MVATGLIAAFLHLPPSGRLPGILVLIVAVAALSFRVLRGGFMPSTRPPDVDGALPEARPARAPVAGLLAVAVGLLAIVPRLPGHWRLSGLLLAMVAAAWLSFRVRRGGRSSDVCTVIHMGVAFAFARALFRHVLGIETGSWRTTVTEWAVILAVFGTLDLVAFMGKDMGAMRNGSE